MDQNEIKEVGNETINPNEEENNSSPAEIAENHEPEKSYSDNTSEIRLQKNSKSKKKRLISIIVVAILLVVCTAFLAVYIYKSTNIKGLQFDSTEDMANYAIGYYICGEKILFIEGSYYGSCNISDIEFDSNEYIDADNNSAKKLDFDINDNLALIQHYIKKTDAVVLGYYTNTGVLTDYESNEKLFAVQGDGVIVPLSGNFPRKPIYRIEEENLLKESTVLKSTLEEFRSDYEDAVNANSKTDTDSETTQETTQSSSIYPTEQEIIREIRAEYSRLASVGYNIEISFSEYSGKTPSYTISISVNGEHYSIGEFMLMSPESQSNENYGHIISVYSSCDASIMECNWENSVVTYGIAAVPVYAMAKHMGDFTGSCNEFIAEFSEYKTTDGLIVYEIKGKNIMGAMNRYKVACAVAYGEAECNLIKSLAY